MKDQGWFLVHRKLQDHWVWKDKDSFDKRSAWIDLILMAYHSEQKVLSNGTFLTVKRGQFPTSVRFLAERWKWSKDRVYRFLKLLEEDGMIVKQSDTERTLLTIVNYDFYQDKQDSNKSVVKDTYKDADKDNVRTTSSQGSSHEQIIINNSEECLNEKRKEMMSERSFDFEKGWNITADAYPKKRKILDAKPLWIDEVLKAPVGEEGQVAMLFYKAIKLFLTDLEAKYSKPEDRENHTPRLKDWIVEDLEYWKRLAREQEEARVESEAKAKQLEAEEQIYTGNNW